jgi:RimJ/RimL family protein N-acetyltransferase
MADDDVTGRMQAVEPALANGDVTLAPFFPEHVNDAYLGWINDPETMRYTEARYRVFTRDSARAYVADSNAGRTSKLFRILYDGRHVGNLRLSTIDFIHRRADIALIIGERELRSRGVGSTAIDLAARHAFGTLSLHKVTAGVYATNVASLRAFEKAAFMVEARLREHYLYEGQFVDGLLLARHADPGDRHG